MGDLVNINTMNILSTPTVRASLILKHGLAADWTAINPVLVKGELGIELDTGLLKVGNGSSNYTELSYINITEASLNNKIEEALTSCIQKPNNFIQGNLVMFDENGDLVDSGVTPQEYAEGAIASEDTPGGVISSSDDNSISVDENGKMTLNRISISNLYIPDEEELILSSGGADFF